MPLLNDQAEFSHAIFDAARAVPPGIVGPGGEPSARRFGVYRNNVMVSLTEALRDAYPAVKRIVGEEFFAAMAREFVLAHPPKSPVMLRYGAGFADFIAGFEPAQTLPYLPDVARIEWAWVEAYHAADAAPLVAADFASMDQRQLPQMRFHLHPALRVVASAHPALSIWQMNVVGEPVPLDLSKSEEAIIHRPEAEVEARLVPQGTAALLAALAGGQSVVKSFEAALSVTPEFDLASVLAALISLGAFIRGEIAETEHG